ncbi:MAG: DUF3095 family protein [Gemmatimonadetes bacterium]|nr:DUF3095 family protein [Gemmatimonadota bacterium]
MLRNEGRLRGWRAGPLSRLGGSVVLRFKVLPGWFLLRFRIRTSEMDWGRYKSDLITNTDYRKFDGTMRLVLAGSSEQRRRLEAQPAQMQETGALSYGVHVASSAIMTCLIEKRQGAHFHFVDAADGGYAAAARKLKAGPPWEEPKVR